MLYSNIMILIMCFILWILYLEVNRTMKILLYKNHVNPKSISVVVIFLAIVGVHY